MKHLVAAFFLVLGLLLLVLLPFSVLLFLPFRFFFLLPLSLVWIAAVLSVPPVCAYFEVTRPGLVVFLLVFPLSAVTTRLIGTVAPTLVDVSSTVFFLSFLVYLYLAYVATMIRCLVGCGCGWRTVLFGEIPDVSRHVFVFLAGAEAIGLGAFVLGFPMGGAALLKAGEGSKWKASLHLVYKVFLAAAFLRCGVFLIRYVLDAWRTFDHWFEWVVHVMVILILLSSMGLMGLLFFSLVMT
jgi:hypothetical protein